MGEEMGKKNLVILGVPLALKKKGERTSCALNALTPLVQRHVLMSGVLDEWIRGQDLRGLRIAGWRQQPRSPCTRTLG